MKLSTRGRYGLMMMLDLAQHGTEEPVSLRAVADRQQLSESYLEQLVSPLRDAGLLRSVRGKQGGYMLARSPSEITVGDIVRAVEGPIAPVECVNDQVEVDCPRYPECPTRSVWLRLRDSITQVLDSINLADLVADAEHGSHKLLDSL